MRHRFLSSPSIACRVIDFSYRDNLAVTTHKDLSPEYVNFVFKNGDSKAYSVSWHWRFFNPSVQSWIIFFVNSRKICLILIIAAYGVDFSIYDSQPKPRPCGGHESFRFPRVSFLSFNNRTIHYTKNLKQTRTK